MEDLDAIADRLPELLQAASLQELEALYKEAIETGEETQAGMEQLILAEVERRGGPEAFLQEPTAEEEPAPEPAPESESAPTPAAPSFMQMPQLPQDPNPLSVGRQMAAGTQAVPNTPVEANQMLGGKPMGFAEGGLMSEPVGVVEQADGEMEEVPPGSLPNEVKDDVPAFLSDGEFVLPADVVRWHGLKSILQLRSEAKEGMAQMQAEGQIQSPSQQGLMGSEYEDEMDD
ncbi:MAG: hypothetical protein IM557_11390 [Chitinophagaceae bacterium]|nr:hypothetical protein [Chitinophagaceae bacterium]